MRQVKEDPMQASSLGAKSSDVNTYLGCFGCLCCLGHLPAGRGPVGKVCLSGWVPVCRSFVTQLKKLYLCNGKFGMDQTLQGNRFLPLVLRSLKIMPSSKL